MSESVASWSDARDACHQDDTTLAIVTTTEADEFVRERFTSSDAT